MGVFPTNNEHTEIMYQEITAYFNANAKERYSFACKPGSEKCTIWVKNEYQVERSVYGILPCQNLLSGDYYLYKGDDDSNAWTCDEAISNAIAYTDKPADTVDSELTTEFKSFGTAQMLIALSNDPDAHIEDRALGLTYKFISSGLDEDAAIAQACQHFDLYRFRLGSHCMHKGRQSLVESQRRNS